MSPVWLALAAAVAIGLVAWGYGTREERVSGRLPPAGLRAAALFLVLGGLFLPAVRGRVQGAPERVVLLDVSRSMSLPVRAGDPGAPSRLDSALVELARLDPDRVYRFGVDPVAIVPDSARASVAGAERSRMRPALEAAKLGGADSVWVLTDGSWDDRDDAERVALELGLGVREIRVAEPIPRTGLARIAAPARARVGDTVRVNAEIRAGGGAAGDSVRVEIRLDDALVAVSRIARPTAGRTSIAELSFVPAEPGAGTGWLRYEVALPAGADPLGASDRLPLWLEVSEASDGAVFVSTVPDWEARFLLPTLDRLVLGGARGFLRLDDDRYLEVSASPRMVDRQAVERSLAGARILVVQSAPDRVPGWLAAALRSHPRVMFFPRGPGDLPGVGVRLTGPLPGEWYPAGPVPPSPAAPLLTGIELAGLPPVRELYAVDPLGRWTVLGANRNRQGEARPLLVAGERDEARWAVASASEWWRWAFRGGESRRVYDGVLSGVVGWLVEDATTQLASLVTDPVPGRPLGWRVRAGASDLAVSIVDEAGDEVWSRTWPDPGPRVVGPALGPGRYDVAVTAQGPDGAFRDTRPLEVIPDPRELLPAAEGPALAIAALTQPRSVEARAPRPIWPFALAIALLCGEWVWRHRIGLR